MISISQKSRVGIKQKEEGILKEKVKESKCRPNKLVQKKKKKCENES